MTRVYCLQCRKYFPTESREPWPGHEGCGGEPVHNAPTPVAVPALQGYYAKPDKPMPGMAPDATYWRPDPPIQIR